MYPTNLAIGANNLQFQILGFPGSDGALTRCVETRPALRCEELSELRACAGWRLRVPSGYATETFRPGGRVGISVPAGTADEGNSLTFVELSLSFMQRIQ